MDNESISLITKLLSVDWKSLAVQIAAIHGAFSAISYITPWTWDNKLLNALQKIIDTLGLAGPAPKK